MAQVAKADVTVSDQGTVLLFTPVSKAAKEWVAENVALEGWQWLGAGFGVDHRMADNLIVGMQAADLVLEGV